MISTITLAACSAARSDESFAAPAMEMASDFGGGYDEDVMFTSCAVRCCLEDAQEAMRGYDRACIELNVHERESFDLPFVHELGLTVLAICH